MQWPCSSCFSWLCRAGGARWRPSRPGGQRRRRPTPAPRPGSRRREAVRLWFEVLRSWCWNWGSCSSLWRCKDAPKRHIRVYCVVKINHNRVSGSRSVEQVLVLQLSYLSGTLDVISGVCEIVVCLFFTHRLQLEIKQKRPLLSWWSNCAGTWCFSTISSQPLPLSNPVCLTMLFHRAAAMSACPRSLKWKQSWEK